MKKIIKEYKKPLLWIDFVLYLIYAVLGYLLLKYPELEVLNPAEYMVYVFYGLALFSLISYFSNRREDDYEFLFLGLNNIIVGSFVFISNEMSSAKFVLGNAILFYTLLNGVSKAIHIYRLNSKKDINLYPKLAVSIIQVLLGLLVISNLYKGVTMQTLIIGYYLLAFGLVSVFEPLVMSLLKDDKIRNYFIKIMNEGNETVEEKEEIKTISKPHEIEMKKPVVRKTKKATTTKKKTVTKKSNVK